MTKVIKNWLDNEAKITGICAGLSSLALSGADAGIAMGGVGNDIAVESADAVLVSDDIGRLPYLFCGGQCGHAAEKV